jgi:hypothetical protein
MLDRSKLVIRLHQGLITFVNTEITQSNWKEVCSKVCDPLSSLEKKQEARALSKEESAWLFRKLYYIGRPSWDLWKKKVGCKSLQRVQQELRQDLIRLTDPDKDLSWLWAKISGIPSTWNPPQSSPIRLTIPMQLIVLTDGPPVLTPDIEDLRLWVYWRLTNLWVDGLLPRLGRCQKCSRFLLAKTRRKTKYCSTRCGQSATAVDRVRKSRKRRTMWQKARESLQRILADMEAIEHKQKLQRPQSEGQVLAEAEKAQEKACIAFATAYPRQKGQGYEEGKRLLAQAKEHVKRLRKKVKGY